MNSPANYENGNSKQRSWRVSLGLMLLAAGFIYVWILPLFRPRGEFLWGHYRLKDIYLGIPIALAVVCVAVVLAVPSRFRRTLSLRLVTLAISVLLALAVCDVGYAFGVMGAWRGDYWLDQAHISRRYSIPENELGFVRKPNVSWRGYVPDVKRVVEYRTDENGFRNPPGNHHADIVFIGDSYTEGAAVPEEDTFVGRVAKTTGLSTVNLGRGAYGPQQELIVLKRYGLAYKPRVVVWQLFEGNDLTDAEAFAEWMKNPRQVNTSLKERFFRDSLLNVWLASTRLKNDSWPMGTLRYPDGTVERVAVRYGYDPDRPTNHALGLSETKSAIEAGYRACQSQGIQLLITVVPTMVQVMKPRIRFDRLEDQVIYLPAPKGNDQKDFGSTIEGFCTQIGCGFVDTFDALQQAVTTGKRDLYIPTDEHLEVGGHAVMAQIVVDWLRSTNIKGMRQG